jgi:hypothetical protein
VIDLRPELPDAAREQLVDALLDVVVCWRPVLPASDRG